MIMDLPHFLVPYSNQIESCIAHYLPLASDPSDPPIIEALRYSVLGGGKRIRAILALITAQTLKGSIEVALPVAAALECMHAYSLVHDDLPAMDNDVLRRGKPTCHIAYDEATAILVGDALQALAFEILAHPKLGFEASTQLKMIHYLAGAVGIRKGMVYGQALDMMYENQTITQGALNELHLAKTGALIKASVYLGALTVEGCDETFISPLIQFAHHLGLAFQIQDDILDVIGHADKMGKRANQDAALDKSTYPQVMGLSGAQKEADLQLEYAHAALNALPFDTSDLEQLACFIIKRNT